MIPPHCDELDFHQFFNPDHFFSPSYMWLWNDVLTNEEIFAQLKEMAEQKAFAVLPLPEPKEFRPKRQPTRLFPDYLSPQYFDVYRGMVEEAKKLDMHVWLYDEGGWPSGNVCGQLVKKYPTLKAQTLKYRKKRCFRGTTVKIPKDCICGILMQKNKKIKMLKPDSKEQITISNVFLWIFYVRFDQNKPDLLNPVSTKRFLELTHDKYNSNMGKEFSNSIYFTFTDEPAIRLLPWTENLAEKFSADMGYDLREHLHSIVSPTCEDDKRIIVDYFEWWSKQFAENYFKQIQKWCHNHNLLSGGHLGGEDETINARRHGFGHVLRPLRYMDIPGVDAIWRQLWPGKNNHHFPHYASTAAHQNGSNWALSESFAVYGTGLTPVQMKWIINYQFVRGINLFNFACYQYSNNDWFIGGERPVFGPINPLWPFMSIIHTYVSRLSYLLSLGSPDIHVGVYYPIRDVWASEEDAKRAATSHDELIQQLDDNLIEFDVIDDDVIAAAKILTLTPDKPPIFNIGPMNYSTLIISYSKWISESSIQKLKEFENKGGKVFRLDEQNLLDKNLIRKEFQQSIQINQLNAKIRVLTRKIASGKLYFISNEDIEPITAKLRFNEDVSPLILDAETGNIYSPKAVQPENDQWELNWNFPFASSLVVYFGSNSSIKRIPIINENRIDSTENNLNIKNPVLSLAKNWNIRKLKSHIIRKDGIFIESGINHPFVPIKLGDWCDVIGDNFSGECEYQTQFNCDSQLISQIKYIDLGEVKYACEVIINGKSLGKKCWTPFIFSIPNDFLLAENDLRIRVSNTLSNQYISPNFKKYWSKNKLGPYHPMALVFEKESAESGLFGPVYLGS